MKFEKANFAFGSLPRNQPGHSPHQTQSTHSLFSFIRQFLSAVFMQPKYSTERLLEARFLFVSHLLCGLYARDVLWARAANCVFDRDEERARASFSAGKFCGQKSGRQKKRERIQSVRQPAFEFANGIKGSIWCHIHGGLKFDCTAAAATITLSKELARLGKYDANVVSSARVPNSSRSYANSARTPPAALAATREPAGFVIAPQGLVSSIDAPSEDMSLNKPPAQPPPQISREEGRGCTRISAYFD